MKAYFNNTVELSSILPQEIEHVRNAAKLCGIEIVSEVETKYGFYDLVLNVKNAKDLFYLGKFTQCEMEISKQPDFSISANVTK